MDVAEANSHAVAAGLSKVDHLEVTGSTNTDLIEAVHADPASSVGRIIVADRQTAGRGRHGRRWHAPAGSALLCSVAVEVGAEVEPSLVNVLLGLAGRAAVRNTTGIELGVKWPNDLVVVDDEKLRDRKVAGILSELAVVGGRRIVVAGIGINLTWPSRGDTVAPELAGAASLAMLGTASIGRDEVLTALIDALGARDVAGLSVAGPAARTRLMAEARSASATLGRRVRIDGVGARESFTGTALDLDDDGRLVVAVEGSRPGRVGSTVAVEVGDVHHLRVVDEL